MSRHHHPAGNGRVTAAASRPSGSAEVLEAHRQAGRAFRAGGVGSFVREQGSGELWMTSLTGPAFRFLMRLQGIGDPAAVSRAELDTYLALIKGPDRGRAFLQVMRSTERTPAKQARYRAAVRDVPHPVQAIWAVDDPAMTVAGYGEKARAAAGLGRLHTIPGKHFPQEDQAPAIARQIAEFTASRQAARPPS